MTPRERLNAQRAEQQAADEQLAKDLARRYGVAWATVKQELDAIAERIRQARAAGETVTEQWLIRQGVIDRLEQRIRVTVGLYVTEAAGRIDTAQGEQLQLGATHAGALVDATTPPSFTPLAAIVHRTRLQGPLTALLNEIAPETAAAARDTLVQAVVRGDNPHVTARALRDTLEAPLWRTLRIARTETIGAYRDGAGQTYRANRNSLAGWIWISKLSPRTCAACWALHGTIYPIDEPFASHPNCRCTPAPLTRSWAELGFPGIEETTLHVEPGPARFARLSADAKRKILGPGKLAAYEDGELSLEDLVQHTMHPVWGPGIRELSLRDVLAS